MSLSSLFKKASSLLGLTSPEDETNPPPMDGEIIYCKNNVCVHPPAVLQNMTSEKEHHPGYLNLRSQDDKVLGSTLILTWIPNLTLQKNPRSIENSPQNPRVGPRRSPRQEYARSDQGTPSPAHSISPRDSVVSSPADDITGTSTKSTNSNDLLNNKRSPHPDGCHGSVGKTVNDLGYQVPQDSDKDKGGMSTDSDSPSTDAQFKSLTNSKGVKDPVKTQFRKQRTSSGRSVTSIEMEGDNLVVVTEEVEDSTFLEDGEDKCKAKSGSGKECKKMVQNMEKTVTAGNPEENSVSSDSSCQSPSGTHYYTMLHELSKGSDANQNGNTCLPAAPDRACVERLKDSLDLKLNVTDTNCVSNSMTTPDIEVSSPAHSSSSSTPTSGPDSTPPSPITPPRYSPHLSPHSPYPSSSLSPEYTVSHNMSFPDNTVVYSLNSENSSQASPATARDQVCGVFSVDLGQMRSLRIFYEDDACTSGQLVIASRESQYKILHFHHGGLDKLADVFSSWKFLAQPKNRQPLELEQQCKQFSVIRPYLPDAQRHPDEGAYEMVTEETWKQHMNDLGCIQDDFHLRKAIFFAGLEPSLRHEMWPFLLHYYPYNSTHEEREHLRNDKYIEYQNIRKQRESMGEEENEKFWRNIQCTVEKDVVRTDRSHPYFAGEDNPNIEVLKNILLNYAVAHPHYGYTQGMSDLLAPVLAEVQHEADAYWCFVGLMQKTIFVSSPKDIDMDKQLEYLRELLRLMVPRFYKLMKKVQDGLELLFCHRWILLCFKREFSEHEALQMWEACWAHYQTDYFHLFICLAIISVYGEDVVEQNLPPDEMLLHFSSLSMHMNGQVILSKARGLLHQFRTRPRIPCTVHDLCQLCSPGQWDSGHAPTIVCRGNHPNDECPYGGTANINT